MKATLCSVLVFFVVAGVLEAEFLAGGYHDREVTEAEVVEAAEFAAAEMNHELVEILAAQSQVVAGTNFRMQLKLRQGNHPPKTCFVEVFKGLNNAGKELNSSECLR